MERRPEEAGISSEGLARALALLDSWVEQGQVPGVAAVVVRRGVVAARHFRGLAAWDAEPRPVTAETVFPLAALTKPVTATAVMLLVEAGEVILDDPVARFVPEFGKLGKEQVRVRHLLTHTSGLPDMLPNNESLRKAHSPLAAFVRSACRLDLAFTPGTRVAYSSTAFLLLAEIVERVAKRSFVDFAAERIFRPLEMGSTGFRPDEAVYPRITRLRLSPNRRPTDWDNNSTYWRQLGAPWGGLFSTADDTARFGQSILAALRRCGPGGPVPILSPATVRLMVQDQTRGIATESGVPEAWGLAWSLPSRQGLRWAGDLASPEAFGQVGAYGAVIWIDPPRDLVCVVLGNQLTNWSTEYRRFACFANALQAAIFD